MGLSLTLRARLYHLLSQHLINRVVENPDREKLPERSHVTIINKVPEKSTTVAYGIRHNNKQFNYRGAPKASGIRSTVYL